MREYMALEQAIKDADVHCDRCWAVYDAREPTPRDIMRHRIENHLGGDSLPMTSSTRCLASDLQVRRPKTRRSKPVWNS